MDTVKEFFNQNWVGTLIGLVGGAIISIVLAFLFKSRPRLSAQTNTLVLVGPNAVLPHEIEFLFRGKKVPQVALSRIAIWNIGNKTIRGDQIVASDPIRILVSDGKVLETTILHRTREVNDFSCAPRPSTDNQIECRFDYLDSNDGVLIQIIHTGTENVKVLGTIREIPKGLLISDVPYRGKGKQMSRKLSPAMFRFLVLCIAFEAAVMFVLDIMDRSERPEYWIVPAINLFFITLLTGVLLSGISLMPPDALSTQITSKEPKKSIWQTLTEKLKGRVLW